MTEIVAEPLALDTCDDDGTIKVEAKPDVRKRTGGWRAGKLLLLSEGFTAVASSAVEVNMVLFMKLVLKESNATAAKAFTAWTGTLNLCTLVGAFLSDSCLGPYRTCAVFQAVFVLGLFLLSVSTQLSLLEPKGCGKFEHMCDQPTTAKLACFYISIYLLALGSGAIEPALVTLGADQFDEEDPKENNSKTAFFSYYYVALNVGSLFAETALVYLENLGKWVLALGISTVSGFVALVFLLIGSSRYRQTETSRNPFSRFYQVIVASILKYKADVPLNGEGLYGVQVTDKTDGDVQGLSREDDLMESAITPRDKILVSKDGHSTNPWHLCTTRQVEEVQCVLRLLPIWLCTVVVSIVFVQVSSLFVLQGAAMDTRLSNFHVPPSSMTAFDIISTSSFIICYEKVLVPLYVKLMKKKPRIPSELQRIGIGMVFSIIAMIVAGIVELRRLKYATGRDRSSLIIFWQVPQYVLAGVSEAFVYVAQWEFFAAQVPKTLKSFGLGLSMSAPALGSYLCAIMVSLVMSVTSKNGKLGWIPPDLNKGHMDRFFFLSAALIALDLLLFVFLATRFKSITKEKKDDELKKELELP